MAELDARIRKWGDSLAIIIPKEIVQQEQLHPHDKVRLTIKREIDFTDVFGLLKNKTKKTAQELKDESRKGWD